MTKSGEIAREQMDWGILSGSVGPRIRLLRNAMQMRSISASAPYGLPTGSLTVLALVAANPGSSQIALARQAGINKSGLVGIVDELERRGLAARDRSQSDRRRNTLRVTPEGEEMMNTLFALVTEQEAPIRDALGAKDMALLISLVDRAITALEESEEA
ncbi:DNA-binding MarR family transcriptional regulator [Altererythrobacter atlanticus]|uniref:Transcriptional regulator SlyA n=1 Tax=Croceibacterium atlanticum TaxID=1267766 RepID=A0A0F7KRP4_9SPHN|nr:MarR family winged helix-turn-helix transcriptional regulator [Croceibacterium atlanticum]AKH43143.1 Transcriptional regulator SlyA [Croceibacterium atlanticum]MBB5732153.1 DNA-binding MarR family transcriptional regulator [Croceibacterium atlanticum]